MTRWPGTIELELELNLFSKLTDHHRDLQEDTLYNPDVPFAHWAGLAKHVYNVYNV